MILSNTLSDNERHIPLTPKLVKGKRAGSPRMQRRLPSGVKKCTQLEEAYSQNMINAAVKKLGVITYRPTCAIDLRYSENKSVNNKYKTIFKKTNAPLSCHLYSPKERSMKSFDQANVKVVARVRPMSENERKLMNKGIGYKCCEVIEDKAINFPEEGLTIQLDQVLDANTKQEEVYERVGKATVQDVLSGYNGTILAYGKTGSGKTYTMFGPNLFDEEKRGVIPRAVCDLFKKWDKNVREVMVTCSMLEIYKEELRDLLVDHSDSELKIKEFPERGIWVDGLTEIPIGCKEELIYWINIGQSRRVWAETCHNAVSSRSHMLLMIELRQTLTDQAEKRGVLNLVDLAGSEKVGKSGVQGELFLEGTKINLSLSALGNVIHALTSKMDHIPYRESKLTRLLQESLGGNYKTTLIVTCSNYSAELAETISTLKFAQRAKKLKNNVKVNIKNNTDQLMKVIERLKEELKVKDAQIQKLMSNAITNVVTCVDTPSDNVLSPISINLPQFISRSNSEKQLNVKGKLPFDYSKKNDIELKYEEARKNIECLRKDKLDGEVKVRKLEISIVEEKKRRLIAEEKIIELEHIIATYKHKDTKDKLKDDSREVQMKVLSNQIKALTEALDDSEMECFKLLKDKKDKLHKDTIELHSLNVIEYVAKSTVHNSFTEKWIKDLAEVGLDVHNDFIGPKDLFNHKLKLKLNDKELLSTSKYSSALDSAVVESSVSPETIIYLLKNQLIDAAILNHNLQRVVSLLAWKLHIEKNIAVNKNELTNIFQKTINSLENLLAMTNDKHQTMKRRIEMLDYEITKLKNTSGKNIKESFVAKSRVKKPIKNRNVDRQNAKKTLMNDTYSSIEQVNFAANGSYDIKEPLVLEEDEHMEEVIPHRKVEREEGLRKVEILEHGLRDAQMDLAWHKTLTDLLMEELIKTREQSNIFKAKISNIKSSSEQAIQDENKNWKSVTDLLKVKVKLNARQTLIES